jgi:hypothetical protein
MAITVKSLKNGVLSVAVGDLYGPVAVTKAAVVKNIRLVNKSASVVTIDLYLYNSSLGITTRIAPVALSISPGAMVVHDDELTLGANDKLTGSASAINAIDYTISGIERDT